VDDPTLEDDRTVLPDVRLLFVLVLVSVLGALALISRYGGSSDTADRLVELGRLEQVVGAMTSDPLAIAELPGIVVTRGPVNLVSSMPRWGEATGWLPLDNTEALFALSLRDPVDGTTLAWCPSSQRFEHSDGQRAYGVDGRLLAGWGPRGMDRRAILSGAGGQVVIDPGRWVVGLPASRNDTQRRALGPSCTGA
jgi:hypothetical protein